MDIVEQLTRISHIFQPLFLLSRTWHLETAVDTLRVLIAARSFTESRSSYADI